MISIKKSKSEKIAMYVTVKLYNDPLSSFISEEIQQNILMLIEEARKLVDTTSQRNVFSKEFSYTLPRISLLHK